MDVFVPSWVRPKTILIEKNCKKSEAPAARICEVLGQTSDDKIKMRWANGKEELCSLESLLEVN